MNTRMLQGLVLVVAAALLAPGIALAQATPPAPAPLTASELVYLGTSVQTQVDVNGAAAVALLGSALDGLVSAAQEQAKTQASGGAPALPIPPQAWAALPMLGPVRDVIKSVSHITVLVMSPAKPVPSAQFLRHYGSLLTPRGWTSLVTVQDGHGPAVLAMVAPEGKGIFLGVNDRKQLVTALVTTERPLGEMIGQIMQAATSAAPSLVSTMMRGKFGGPPPPPAAAAAPPAPAAPPVPQQ